MTKGGKRNRRKSCSSAADGEGDSGVKDKTGTQMSASAASKATKNTTPDSIRGWFSSLSGQDRAAASSIEDTAFVATLLDLASSSGHPHHTDGTRDIDATWSTKFSLEQVEQAYKANLVKTKDLDFVSSSGSSSKEIHSRMQRSTTASNQSAMVPMKGDNAIPKTMQGEAATKAKDAPLGAPPTVDADTFRIRGTTIEKPTESTSDAATATKQEKPHSFLNHLRIVYPSVYKIILTHPAFQDIRDASSTDTLLKSPLITLDPRSLGDYSAEETLCNFDSLLRAADLSEESFLSSEERYNTWRQAKSDGNSSSWIQMLKPLVSSNKTATLSLLLVIRMEASVMAAYDGVHAKADKDSPAAVVMEANVNPQQKSGDEPPSTKTQSSRVSFLVAAEAVQRHASNAPSSRHARAMDHVQKLVEEQFRDDLSETALVLLPFSNVLHCRQVVARDAAATTPLMPWNTALEMALKTLVDDVESSESSEPDKHAGEQLTTTTGLDDVVVRQASTSSLQPHGQPAKKNNKKKKKKKKRKASNADQSTCSSDTRSAMTNETHGETHRRNDGRSSLPKVVETTVDQSNGTKNAATPAKHEEPETPAKAQADTVRSDSAAVVSKDAAVDSGNKGKVEASEKVEKSAEASGHDNKASHHDPHDWADDHSAWETVEAKGRGNRNRRTCGQSRIDRSNVQNASSQASTSAGATSGSSKKGKKHGTSRKRNAANRKMAKDIISSVLDGVDVEVRRRRSQVAKSVGSRMIPPGQLSNTANGSTQGSAWQAARPMTMRDVVLGRLRAEAENAVNAKTAAAVRCAKKVQAGGPGKTQQTGGDKKKAPILRNNGKGAWVADQSTAPTVPETLSGISANTQSSDITDGDNASLSCVTPAEHVGERSTAGVGYSSSGDVAVFESAQQQQKVDKETSPAPPLQTLPWPGNTNSASSSVASSLEVPHGRHLHRHHSSVSNENDVGYHLLDVCDRLSRDMDVFMGRRAVALCARRQERGALLAALQDTASKLWAGRCHVEMYGSCATQLDLPSSDLDAVICGLDRRPEGHMNAPLARQRSDEQVSVSRPASFEDDMSAARSITSQESQSDMSLKHPYSPGTTQYMHVPALSPNAERVIRLAAELERQPWCVQVKAIPTATVPVVKILADPSRLPGAVASVMSGGSDWMMSQQHMAAQAAAAGVNHAPPSSGKQPPHPQGGYYAPNNASAHGGQSHYAHHSPPPWRGADVMNGLFPVDITFEGPEHAGIGSTIYSARFVQDACNEVGLPPDRAPVVQALMVLKELLAQRRLNEPFSGGLSSYALLLMVDAVLKERQAIQLEMEKIERQRLVVAAGDSNVKVGKRASSSDRESRQKDATAKPGSSNDKAKNAAMEKSTQPAGPAKQSGAEKPAQGGNAPTQKRKTAKSDTAGTKSDSQPKIDEAKTTKAAGASTSVDPPTPKSGSSWACIAKKNTALVAGAKAQPQTSKKAEAQGNAKQSKPQTTAKVATFADAVNKRGKAAENTPIARQASQGDEGKKLLPQQQAKKSFPTQSPTVVSPSNGSTSSADVKEPVHSKAKKSESPSSVAVESGSTSDSNGGGDSAFDAPSLFPQGSNDVLEVLCSGETTAGKLLLHFLLYYGRHFDSHAMAIDLSGKHHPDAHLVGKRGHHNGHLSPYVPRTGGGSIDPVTGMLTVYPLVIYDPLEGAEENNVARSCFAWSNIRWVFAQSYMTLSSAVERSGTPPATLGGNHGDGGEAGNREARASTRVDRRSGSAEEQSRELPSDNMVSPLLELLLSF